MTEVLNSTPSNERISRESPQLVALLKEMKAGLDNVGSKVEALASKAKGLPIQGHPVVRSLVEMRLFLEKIRPLDRKMQYQIQKLTNATTKTVEKPGLTEKQTAGTEKPEDLLRYRPNPDLLISKTNATSEDGSGVYRPPKFAPTAMEEDKMSRQEKNALRKEKQMLRQAKQSSYVRELMDDLDGKPEEIRENVGAESREATKYFAQMEERARREEELFTRAPITKAEKKKMKNLTKSRNGLLGLTESFYDEIKSLPLEDSTPEEVTNFSNPNSGVRKFNKRKRKH